MMLRSLLTLLALSLTGPTDPAALPLNALIGAAQAAEDPFRVETDNLSISEGGSGQLPVYVRVPPGFHVYRDMLSVEVISSDGLTASPAVFPLGLLTDDPASPGATREMFEQDVRITVPLQAPAGVSGRRNVRLLVRYQGCKRSLCYMPGEQELTATITVGGTARPILPGGGPVEGAVPSAGIAPAPPAEEIAVTFTGGPGAPGTLKIHADLQGEWHINRNYFSVTLPSPGGWVAGEAQVPPGVKTGSEADGTAREDLEHDFDVILPLQGSGPDTVAVDVWYQACKGVSLCRMPTTETIQVSVKGAPVGAGAGAAIGAQVEDMAPPAGAKGATDAAGIAGGTAGGTAGGNNVKSGAAGDSAFDAAASQGVGALLLLCFIAGIGVSFTPCVLPVVPLTMGIIGARSAGSRRSRLKALSLAATYVLGQAAVYTGLAVVVAMTGGLFGSWLQSPVVTGTIALFFVAMGFSMFGFFDVQMPGFLQSRLQGGGPKGGYAGAAVLGMIGALLAGPCSGPVVASILVVIGKEGDVAKGAMLMFSFSLGMGMIFLVTGALAGWLPSRGAWMITVKKGMGVLLWLMAIYFSAAHLSVAVTALATAAVLLVTGVFAWPDPEEGEDAFTVRLRQLYSVVAGVTGAWLLVGTMATQGFILPPIQLSAGGAATQKAGIPWLADHDQALARARESGRPMMIDFTAEWCAACHELEKYTYTDSAVIAESGRFVPLMLDCTDDKDPAIKALQARYGVSGLPTIVFVMPDGTIVKTLIGFIEAPEFLTHMKEV